MTAQIAAFARALGSREPDPRVRNPDYLAERMLPAFCQIALLPGVRHLSRALYDGGARGMYCFHQIRSRYIDDLVCAELDRGAEQLVIMGAGLDTRAYRFSTQLQKRPVFEVDHPATQRWKLDRVEPVKGRTDVRFVGVNFETDSLADCLDRSGFELGRPTLFLWEGVSMYLTEAAITTTLAFLRQAGAGSSVMFDYVYRDMLDGGGAYYGGRESLRSARRLGEPYIFGMDPGKVREFLFAHGFELISDVDIAELSDRYLMRSDGRLLGRAAAYARLAHASVRVP